ncbi:hypothetical protein M758_1G148200 [Ceratodon purpureus]|nr:hypothetical protein M758_1G148200 [Ceratodon purpureus]
MAGNFSDSSLGLVAELVRWHLPARSLVRFKLVSKEWNTWCSQNLVELAKVRRQTPSRDWYFPIRSVAGAAAKPLAAIHHPSAEEHEELEHKLPALDFLPNCLRSFDYICGRLIYDFNIEAISGGLFLLKHYPIWDDRCTYDLYVVNPLTRNWRKLSHYKTNVAKGLSHAQMVVDESARTYTVIEFTDDCMNVYSSRSRHWVCNPIRISGVDQRQFSASACADGYIYVCGGILYSWIDGGSVVDIWKFPIQPSAEQQPTLCRTFVDLGGSRGSRFQISKTPKLVECMGGIYIVACKCEVSAIPHFVRQVDHEVMMKWEFHIFKFQEGSRKCPLHVQHDRRLPGYRNYNDLLRRQLELNDFCCTAKSGVIWLAYGDNHLLQYDVVSNAWKDGYRSTHSFSTENKKLFLPSAYTPSFDLSP